MGSGEGREGRGGGEEGKNTRVNTSLLLRHCYIVIIRFFSSLMGDGIRIDNQRLTPWHSLIDLRCGRMQKFWCFDIRTIYRIQNFSLFYFSSFLFLITRFLLFNVRFQRNTRSHCFRFVPRGRNYVLVWALLFLFTRSVFSQRKKLFSSGQTFFVQIISKVLAVYSSKDSPWFARSLGIPSTRLFDRTKI